MENSETAELTAETCRDQAELQQAHDEQRLQLQRFMKYPFMQAGARVKSMGPRAAPQQYREDDDESFSNQGSCNLFSNSAICLRWAHRGCT